MTKFLISALLALTTVLSAHNASATVIYTETSQNWQLMAWDGNNQFCALKTYFDGDKTVSIRMDANRRLKLVVFDPAVDFDMSFTNVQIAFDGDHFGNYEGVTVKGSPHQVFISIGDVNGFLDMVMRSSGMTVRSENLDYEMNLFGTETVGSRLGRCVDTFFI